MPVFALWSAPRARSKALFRSMLERGDMTCIHEPFSDLAGLGETDVEGRAFTSTEGFLAWLVDGTAGVNGFVKDTTGRRFHAVLNDRRLLAECRHAFLIRRPGEIAASSHAIEPDIGVDAIGLEALAELHAAVVEAGGRRPIVIDSDDLVNRPRASVAAYCDAVGLPFVASALTWKPGPRHEWRRSARWHLEVSASTGFVREERACRCTVESSDELARLAAHHLPFYEQLYAHRVDVTTWDSREQS